MIKNYYLALLVFCCAVSFGYGQVTENFDGWTDLSYGGISTFSSASGNWETNNSFCEPTNARSGRAVRFNDDSGENEYLLYSGLDGNGKDNGIGDISFWYRHWNGGASNVQFQTQYSTNGGTLWVNIGGVINATSAVYSQYTNTVNLSADNVLIRVISIDDAERLMIDDFVITDYVTAGPAISATPTTINNLDYAFGSGPSAPQSFDVEGTLLVAGTAVTSNSTDFEVSLTMVGGYASSVNVPVGTLNGTTTIYTRLAAGLAVNTYSNTISISNTTLGLASTPTINVNGEVTPGPCSDLMISEYHEASSGNEKYIEIYNPTAGTIDLSNYRLVQFNNGSITLTGQFILALSGSIASYSTFVVANDNGTLCLTTADLCTPSSVMKFNGNDAIVLQTSSGSNIDVIGTIGSSSSFAANVVLRRNSTVQSPATTYNAAEWTSSLANDTSNLGSHTSDCGTPTAELQLVDDTATNQNCGFTLDLGVTGTNAGTLVRTFDIENSSTVDLDISSLAITGVNLGDFAIVSPAGSFTVTPGNSQTVTIQFTPIANGTRTAELTISNNDLDEGTCIVNLTGLGVTPVPEIRVETNAGNNIPDGAGIAVVYDNNFGNENEGATSVSKTYLIENLGTGNLIISSITISNTEFTITSNPSPITLPPGDSTPVLIAFSPSTPGIKNATVTINNNDSNEASFSFALEGNGICGSSVMTSSPSSGSVGTILSIVDLSTNISTAIVSLNGTPLTVTVINNNEIEVSVPTGAQTGNLFVTNSFGCESSFPFSVINNQIGGCEGGTFLSEIFITEVTDATYGGLSYVELYNATGAAVDLSNYTLDLYQNGNTDNTNTTRYKTANLSGIIGVNQTYVIAIGNDIYDCPQAGADGSFADLELNIGGLNLPANEHDYLGLYNSGVLVDQFGVFGDSAWMDAVYITISGDRGFNFRRLNTATPLPNSSFDDNDWNIIDWAGSGSGSCSGNDYSDIGLFDFSLGTPPLVTSILSTTTACNESTISVTASQGVAGGNTLEYYWYYYNPTQSGLGWQTITNGGIYTTTVNSPDLIISDALSAQDYQFYCEVREDDATCYSASDAIQITISTATWDGMDWIWNDGTPLNTVPSLATFPVNVILTGPYDTALGGAQSSFGACNLFVDNVSLNIDNGDFVEVENNLDVYGTSGAINIEPEGSFVQINDSGIVSATVSTNITVNKITAPSNNWYEYTYWSSPVFEETPATGLTSSNPNRRFQFNAQYFRDSTFENTNDDSANNGAGIDDIDDQAPFDWGVIATQFLVPGVGYASTHDPLSFSSTPGCPGLTCRIRYTFSGLFNNGIITVPMYRNDTELNDNNWNFVGNPYASAISADAFLAANMGLLDESILEPNPIIDGAIYLWSQNTAPTDTTNGNENINFSQSDYAIINGTGQTAAQSNGGDPTVPSRHIPSGQGFFISMANSAPATQVLPSPVTGEDIQTADLTFNNAMRVIGNNNQFFRNATQSNLDNKLWVNLSSDNGVFSQVLIGYLNNATDDYDGMFFDAPRNASTGVNSIIYTLIPNAVKKFAIQGKNTSSINIDESIPLGFYTSIDEATIYTFSIAQLEGDFMTENAIYVIDKLYNTIHELSASDFTFTSEAGEFNNRFEIVFRADALSIDNNLLDPNDLSITELANGDVEIKVGNTFTITKVAILDVLGRQIYNLTGTSSRAVYNLSRLSKAPYIAKVTLSNGQVISKKAIKQR